jgi:UDP-N-acetylglucosamine--N-acetylmuramyl-(pentapeptide) pyrophosphoryl-undecaprenol N-acetylglucosamine transferase
MTMRTALMMAGGTGGHIYPGLAVAEALVQRQWKVHWLGTERGMEVQILAKTSIPLHTTRFEGFVGRGLLTKLITPLKLLNALLAAWRVMRLTRPDIVIGMGGYPALPGGLIATLMRIPLVIHEQNAVAGKTNRILARLADAVLCGFSGAFPSAARVLVVGNPVRRGLVEIGVNRPAWDGEQTLRMAIIGGSRGAAALNEIAPKAMAKIPPAQRPHILHQTGRGNVAPVKAAYLAAGVDADIHEYIDDMATAYANVDVFLCRSGASTVSELACAEMPAILVPYPYHADQQQLHNARYLSAVGAAQLMEQSALTAETLCAAVMSLTSEKLLAMRVALRAKAQPDATVSIVKSLEALVGSTREI